MKMKFLIITISTLFFTTYQTLLAQVSLPAIVRDSMIIQRDSKLKIWGWASPGEKVNIKFNKKNYKTRTTEDGKWLVWLEPTKAGGPFQMEIKASNNITIKDILVGDVWLCSGQSNMVHYLDLHKERYAGEIAKADYPQIRQFLISTKTNLVGPSKVLPNGNWKAANPEDVKRFSVVAYFFAKKLYDQYQIPIGLINASVGGTPIEAWTSEEGLKEFPEIVSKIQKNKDTAYVNSTNRAAMAAREFQNQKKETDRGLTEEVKWFETNYVPKNWRNINIPGYWEDQGVRDLDGVVWYRKELKIPSSMTGVPAKVALGRIVDADKLYINGVEVGNTTYQYPQRRYNVPQDLLKSGKNLFVIRVVNNAGKGGFVPDKPYYISAGDQTVDLKGYWQYKVGDVFIKDENLPQSISAQNQPTALFNAMVAPITDYAIKGIVWYQGESNAGNPGKYKELLPAFIKDWRKQWAQPQLPFLNVQLPNFMEVDYLPTESNWAFMREAQLEATNLTNTGMAVTIDLGEWNDIHPGNKKPIGDRLALIAQKMVYGEEDIVYSGPIYKSARVDGNKVILSFDHVGSGLISGNGEALSHFAIAGPDEKFKWGQAVIKDNTVEVWHENIKEPLYIRYAWADNPDFANLYNKEGLPASPFKTGKLNDN